MRYRHILTVSWLVTAACVVIRTLQLMFTVDQSNGFYIKEYKDIGIFMTSAIFIGVGVMVFVAATVKRNPTNLPKASVTMGIVSVVMGISVIFDLLNMTVAANVPAWQVRMLDVLGVIAIIFFFAYGVCAVAHCKLPSLLFAAPTLFYVFKIICSFVTISRISLTGDIIFMMFADCATLIFMFEFAKVANHIDTKYIYKKVLTSGLCAFSLNMIFVVPPIVSGLLTEQNYLKVSLSNAVIYFVSAIFIYVFIIDMFKMKNLKSKHSHHKNSTSRYEKEDDMTFYFGETETKNGLDNNN